MTFDWTINVSSILTFAVILGGAWKYLEARHKKDEEAREEKIEERHKENQIALAAQTKTIIELVENKKHLDECVDELKESLRLTQNEQVEVWKYLAKLHLKE